MKVQQRSKANLRIKKIGKFRLAPEGLTGYDVLKDYIEAHTEAFHTLK